MFLHLLHRGLTYLTLFAPDFMHRKSVLLHRVELVRTMKSPHFDGIKHYPNSIHVRWKACACVYLHEWLILMVNVGKYTSPMDAMGQKSMVNLKDSPYRIVHCLGWQYNDPVS